MKILRKIHKKIGILPIFIVVIFGTLALFGDLLCPYDPNAMNLMEITKPMSTSHLLGTDHLGRDLLSRTITGAQTTLKAVAVIILFAASFGMTVGLISGFLGGWIDELLMRIGEFGLSVPSLVIALGFIGVFGTGYWNMVFAVSVAWYPIYARLTRGVVISVIHQPYIESLRVLGASRIRIILKHIFPEALGAILIYASVDAGILALVIANLSFLGLGVQPPLSEWGQMLVTALPYLEESPRQVIVPGVSLTIMVIGFNILGERIALSNNPKQLEKKNFLKRRELFRLKNQEI
jgi:peptide/nickel transport system permease protein